MRDWRAKLVFTDETGLLLLPLVRRTLAPRGHTPTLLHRASHRDKVSAAAALTLSADRGHLSLYYQTYPDAWVDVELYADFVSRLLRQTPDPLVLVHDGGNMHRGGPMRDLDERCSRIDLNVLPPYAPELNPVEYLWKHLKDDELSNFVPFNIVELETTACQRLEVVRRDQHRLKSFWRSSPLPWAGLTGVF